MKTNAYLTYYLNQAGHGDFPIYRAASIQRGYGLGSVFKSLFRFIKPIFSSLKPVAAKALPVLGSELARAATGVVSDLSEGADFKTAAKTRFKSAGENLRDRAAEKVAQLGTGRSIKRKSRQKRVHFAKRLRSREDLFT